MRPQLSRSNLLLAACLLLGGVSRAAAQDRPPGRLAVAVLQFEDQTGDTESAHWRDTLQYLCDRQLGKLRAVRLCDVPPSVYHRLKLSRDRAPSPAQARQLGERIEAQRIVWGKYGREGGTWQVTAHVLNVATGKASAPLRAASADWFVIGDQLTEQLLRELAVTPSAAERAQLSQRDTSSPMAWELFSKAYALDTEERSDAARVELLRQAIAADPQYTQAYLSMAAALDRQLKTVEAEEAVRQVLKLRPEDAEAHQLLGFLRLHQGKPIEAEAELREALRLAPENALTLMQLGDLAGKAQKWDEAIAAIQEVARLRPSDASIHAFLGHLYSQKRDRARALAALREAQRLAPADASVEQISAVVCEALGEVTLALEHCQKFFALARQEGLKPEELQEIEGLAQALKKRLTPVYVTAAPPKRYGEQELQAALRQRLTPEERALVFNPIAGSPEMKRWAEQLTQGARGGMDKAKKLFEALMRSYYRAGGHRTAQEVFAAWEKPAEAFNCQEYAKLFVALARALEIDACLAEVQGDFEDQSVAHACAAVFAGGKAFLVDPAYSWFGVPHRRFRVLDDLQALAFQADQQALGSPEEGACCRLAVKLDPHSAREQAHLARVALSADRWEEARQAVAAAERLEPGRWDESYVRAFLAEHDGKPAEAIDGFRKAVELNPAAVDARLGLAVLLRQQGKLKEARAEYRACLQQGLDPDLADSARRAIAEINEKIGAD